MRVYLNGKDIEALLRGIGLLKIEYEGIDPEDTPQAPQDFWDEFEAAEEKLKRARRKNR